MGFNDLSLIKKGLDIYRGDIDMIISYIIKQTNKKLDDDDNHDDNHDDDGM